MSGFEDSELGPGPEIPASEREELLAMAERLERQRPLPSARFRGELRRGLLDGRTTGAGRPRRLKAIVAAYAGSGFVLLAIAVLGVGGLGPLSAG